MTERLRLFRVVFSPGKGGAGVRAGLEGRGLSVECADMNLDFEVTTEKVYTFISEWFL